VRSCCLNASREVPEVKIRGEPQVVGDVLVRRG
jgi:hypothetical protein